MRRPRRLPAVAALLLILQFVLLGGGIVCAMPGMGGRDASPMAQMDMGGGSSMPAAPQHAPSHDQAPCPFPWAPANCHSMAPCAPAAVASPRVALLPAPAIEHDVAQLVVLAPPSRNIPPELPPPRA